jgi:hypothetical protein
VKLILRPNHLCNYSHIDSIIPVQLHGQYRNLIQDIVFKVLPIIAIDNHYDLSHNLVRIIKDQHSFLGLSDDVQGTYFNLNPILPH